MRRTAEPPAPSPHRPRSRRRRLRPPNLLLYRRWFFPSFPSTTLVGSSLHRRHPRATPSPRSAGTIFILSEFGAPSAPCLASRALSRRHHRRRHSRSSPPIFLPKPQRCRPLPISQFLRCALSSRASFARDLIGALAATPAAAAKPDDTVPVLKLLGESLLHFGRGDGELLLTAAVVVKVHPAEAAVQEETINC